MIFKPLSQDIFIGCVAPITDVYVGFEGSVIFRNENLEVIKIKKYNCKFKPYTVLERNERTEKIFWREMKEPRRYYCKWCGEWFDHNVDGCPECGSQKIIDTGEDLK